MRRAWPKGITVNSWITILGTNLSLDTNDWSNAVVNGKLPTSFDGVSVSVAACRATSITSRRRRSTRSRPMCRPDPVTVTVTAPNGTTAPVNTTVGLYGPAFFS
jgi:uncharacterized protein (TIGR03437 family)